MIGLLKGIALGALMALVGVKGRAYRKQKKRSDRNDEILKMAQDAAKKFAAESLWKNFHYSQNPTLFKIDDNKPHRTITEILIEADACNNPYGLHVLWNEIAKNKYKYILIELDFAQEHIQMLADKTANL